MIVVGLVDKLQYDEYDGWESHYLKEFELQEIRSDAPRSDLIG